MKTETISGRKFIRVAEVERCYGIKPGKMYALFKSNHVRSVSLAEGNKRKGTRLVDVESLQTYLQARLA